MLNPTRKLLCSYCFRHFGPEDIHWRCNSNKCTSTGLQPDVQYTEYQREFNPHAAPPPLMPHWFPSPPPKSKLQRILPGRKLGVCDQCSRESSQRLCPHCHNELPFTVDTTESHIIAVLGAKAVGKTNYIAVLINELRKLGAEFEFTLLDLNDYTTSTYKNDFYQPLFRNKKVIDMTQKEAGGRPLMYRLKFLGKGELFNRNRCLTLVFFDTAGENLDSDSRIGLRNRYLTHASGLLLLVDPLQIEGVRDRLEGTGCPLPSEFTEPTEILQRIVRVFHSERPMGGTKKIDVPVAVAFTKSDVLRDYKLLPPGNAIYNQPRHQGVFREDTRQQISDELNALFVNWKTTELEQLMQGEFKEHSYFGLSSLGEAPDPSGQLFAISPFRVEDPLLWLLSRLGYLKTQKA